MSEALSRIRRLHLIMGLQCNVRCVMCYQRDFSSRHNMPAVIYREHLKPLYPHLSHVKIQGGEPTIMPNCKDFAQMARAYPNLRLTLATNGVVLSEFWLETLLEQCSHVNFSINAATPQTYAKVVRLGNFERALENIGRVLALRQGGQPRVSLSAVAIRPNLGELADFAALGARLGVDWVEFLVDPILSTSGLPPRVELEALVGGIRRQMAAGLRVDGLGSLERALGLGGGSEAAPAVARPKVCPLPFGNLVVDERGDVRVCCDTWQVIGNTHRAPIEEIVESGPARRFRDKVKKGDYSWCSPQCPDNPAPRRSALWRKYLFLARRDPADFASKVLAKLKQRREV